MPLMQDCPPLLIISKAGYYWSIVAHSTSPWLVFLASVQQRRALKFAFAALKSISTHCYIYQKCTENLQNELERIK